MQHEQSVAKVNIIKYLLRLSDWQYSLLDSEQIADISKLLDWMFPTTPELAVIFPSFEINGIKYFLPLGKFLNGSAIEYATADQFYVKYMESGNEDDLMKLFATLAREQEPDKTLRERNNDERVRLYSDAEINRRVAQMKGADAVFVTATLLYFSAIKAYIHNTYGRFIFEPVVTDKDGKIVKIKPNYISFGWWTIFNNSAGAALGIVEQVKQMNFHALCQFLVEQSEQSRRQKEEMDKQNIKNATKS